MAGCSIIHTSSVLLITFVRRLYTSYFIDQSGGMTIDAFPKQHDAEYGYDSQRDGDIPQQGPLYDGIY